jgi:hypothetical protein
MGGAEKVTLCLDVFAECSGNGVGDVRDGVAVKMSIYVTLRSFGYM